jgi:RNA polymerase sigma factor (sigma-70 family)
MYPKTPITLLARLPQPVTQRDDLAKRVWQRSWEEFIQIYGPAIRQSVCAAFHSCRWTSVRPEMADEVLSDVLVTLVRRLEHFSYNPELGTFRGFVRRIVRGKVIDRIKLERAGVQLDEAQWDSIPDEESEAAWEVMDREERVAWRAGAMGLLLSELRERVTPQNYQIFEMTKLMRRPVQEVIDELGVSRTHVDNANSRAIRLLAEMARRMDFKGELNI